MIRHIAVAAMVLAAVADGATAAKQCLDAQEIEAEQAIRFQAELMVVSDTCGQPTYVQFTQRNRESIIHYQHEMIEHFRRSGQSRAEARFDTYLTRLANEVSLRTGAQPVSAVCANAASMLATASKLNNSEFRHYIAERAAAEQKSEYKHCKK